MTLCALIHLMLLCSFLYRKKGSKREFLQLFLKNILGREFWSSVFNSSKFDCSPAYDCCLIAFSHRIKQKYFIVKQNETNYRVNKNVVIIFLSLTFLSGPCWSVWRKVVVSKVHHTKHDHEMLIY